MTKSKNVMVPEYLNSGKSQILDLHRVVYVTMLYQDGLTVVNYLVDN